MPKKTDDMSNIKSSAEWNKSTKSQVTQPGFESSVASTSGPMYNLPPPDRLRELRLTQLAEILNQVLKKLSHREVGLLRCLIRSTEFVEHMHSGIP